MSPLADLPQLQKLDLGYPGSTNGNKSCTDFTPLARCTALRELTLAFNRHWPNLSGIERLTQPENPSLLGSSERS